MIADFSSDGRDAKTKRNSIFKGFKEKSDREIMRLFTEIPQLATYTDNYEEFYF